MLSPSRLTAAVVLVAAGLAMTGCSTLVAPPQPTATAPAPVVTQAATQTIAEGCALVKKATVASTADLKASVSAIAVNPSIAGPKFKAFAVALEGVMPKVTNPNVTLMLTSTDSKIHAFMHAMSAYIATKSSSNVSNLSSSAIGAMTSTDAMSVLCF
jgi:hypothetical protein